jgi:hypothetical protein
MPTVLRPSAAPRLEINLRQWPDAAAILREGNRQVRDWFKEYDSASTVNRRRDLASEICRSLWIQAVLEEEIFYPALLIATNDYAIFQTALNDRSDLRRLIHQIFASNPRDEPLDSKIHELRDVVERHVADEESPAGHFIKAGESEMDLDSLGSELRARRRQLQIANSGFEIHI